MRSFPYVPFMVTAAIVVSFTLVLVVVNPTQHYERPEDGSYRWGIHAPGIEYDYYPENIIKMEWVVGVLHPNNEFDHQAMLKAEWDYVPLLIKAGWITKDHHLMISDEGHYHFIRPEKTLTRFSMRVFYPVTGVIHPN